MTIARDYDYIASPKVDGYRAYHLVVEKDGFLVEVQLRSAAQHAWAEAIEAADRDNPLLGLKEGRAPDLHVEYYRLGAQLLAHRERSEVPEHEVLSRFRDLHQRVIRPR